MVSETVRRDAGGVVAYVMAFFGRNDFTICCKSLIIYIPVIGNVQVKIFGQLCEFSGP